MALTVLASVSLAVTSLYTLHCYILGCKLAEQPVARSVAAMEYVSVCIHGHFARSDLYFSPTDNNQKNQNRWKIKLALGYVFLWHLLPFTAYIIHSQVRHKAFMSSESLLPSPKRTAVYTDNTSPPPYNPPHTAGPPQISMRASHFQAIFDEKPPSSTWVWLAYFIASFILHVALSLAMVFRFIRGVKSLAQVCFCPILRMGGCVMYVWVDGCLGGWMSVWTDIRSTTQAIALCHPPIHYPPPPQNSTPVCSSGTRPSSSSCTRSRRKAPSM